MTNDGMTPFVWDKGKQAADMLPRARCVITAGAKLNKEFKVIHTALSVEDEKDRAMKRKRQKVCDNRKTYSGSLVHYTKVLLGDIYEQ